MKKLVILALAIIICFTVTSCFIRRISFGSNRIIEGTYADASKYQAGSFSYRASDVNAISLDYVSGDVKIVQSDSKTLNVTETGTGIKEDQAVRWYLDGRTLRIQFCKSGYSGKMPAKNLTLEIPFGVDLDITMSSGDVSFDTDVNAGEVEIGLTSGNLSIKTLRCGDFSKGTTSGNTNIDALYANDVEFGSTSGNTKVGTLEASDVKAGATSGSLNISSVVCDDFDIGGTSGDITLGLEKCSSLKIGCTSADIVLSKLPAGGATIEYAKTSGNLKADGYKVRGNAMIFGDGACNMVIATTSGDLTIKD